MDGVNNKISQAEFIKQSFENQLRSFRKSGYTNYELRKKRLQNLLKSLENFRPQLKTAMYQDFRKNSAEVDITEILPIISELSHAIRYLRHWMQNKRVDIPITLIGTRNWIKYEPKGVVLIISPFNFPILLSIGPLVSALAAGNHVILKPSEFTPHTNKVIAQLISESFPPEQVAWIEGDAETAQELLKLPFHHIFFTGSSRVGKIVMQAAAKHLTPVTLELGGKSPTIVDESANIPQAAKRIVWSKFMNGGQLCVAPDFVLVNEKVKEKLIKELRSAIITMYSEDSESNSDFARIINQTNYQRLLGYLDELAAGNIGTIIGGKHNLEDNFIEPTLIIDPPMDSLMMKHEIFGPLLPIVGFQQISEVVELLKSKEKPLSLYIYSQNQRNIRTLLTETSSGNVAINHSAIQFFNPHLPFGGIGKSGMGKAHGIYSFKTFSNAKGVLKQNWTYSLANPFMPPYSAFTQKMVNAVVNITKWI